MVWIPGGEFLMVAMTSQANPVERPADRVRVEGFWIDQTEVTNSRFQRFVEAGGYRTAARRPVTGSG